MDPNTLLVGAVLVVRPTLCLATWTWFALARIDDDLLAPEEIQGRDFEIRRRRGGAPTRSRDMSSKPILPHALPAGAPAAIEHRTLVGQQADFTAEGSPPPGRVALSTPAVPDPPARAAPPRMKVRRLSRARYP
ncbi:MAG: hypothetical protein KIT17_21280 [Rubrivivax sp.]|nr:hypothetical protein [Rubrivivax sp.]